MQDASYSSRTCSPTSFRSATTAKSGRAAIWLRYSSSVRYGCTPLRFAPTARGIISVLSSPWAEVDPAAPLAEATAPPPERRTPRASRPPSDRSGVRARLARPPVTSTRARPALAGAALAACLVGLVGVDAGILWIVAGVFTLRSLVRAEPGAAWGLACMGAGLRWGSLGI